MSRTIPRPPRPKNDLRTQISDRIIETALAGLAAGDERRAKALEAGALKSYGAEIARAVTRAFGAMPFGAAGGRLNTRVVSSHDIRHGRVENVLFESYPGWEVNASVFVPKGKGPFPTVVIPVGHSGKQFENYQIPAQAFASAGYLAVLFDPPGQASEKRRGNDHFRDGVRSTLFGITSNRFFVLDALRCIDYLETRSDADLSKGTAMTGVSGGGITTLFGAMFDPRVTCFGPSCCLNRLADHPVGNAYSDCPEDFWHGRLSGGIDNVDIALACIPKPMLYMAGRDDEVFLIEPTRILAATVAACYAGAGIGERFEFFEDGCGHAYTLDQTARFIRFTERFLTGVAEPSLPRFDRGSFEMLDYEMLKCRPSDETTMHSIHIDLAREAREARSSRADREPRSQQAGATAASLIDELPRILGRPRPVDSWEESGPFRLWAQGYSEALCRVEDLDIPMSILRPWRPIRTGVEVLFIDDLGRKHALESSGIATSISRMIERDGTLAHPALFVPDLPAFGECEPLLTPYQTTGWGSMDRLLAYLSFGNGDGILAIQARAAATIIDEVVRRSSLPASKTVIVGTGYGGIVALLAAALTTTPVQAVTISSLASFEHLLAEEFYAWPSVAFLPGALNVFDLPELVASLRSASRRVLVIDPLDGAKKPLPPERCNELFGNHDLVTSPGSGVAATLSFLDEIAGRHTP